VRPGPNDAEYRAKLTTPEDAVAVVRDDALITFGPPVTEPPALLWALATRLRTGDLGRLRVFSGPAGPHSVDSLLALDLVDQVEHLSHFVGAGDRGKVAVGLGGYLPNHFHQLPRLITDYMRIDVALVSVSPMDRAGYFTLGLGNDFTSTAARHARHLIVEVNDQVPRVHGDSRIHVSEVHAIVECSTPLVAVPPMPAGPEDDRIADAVATLVPDGATMQIGVGAIPDAVCARLHDRTDLGIHTEMLSPGLIALVRAGVVTGARKTLHRGKHIFTVAACGPGDLELLDDNPAFESHPVSYTNDPSVIAQNERMVSINAVLQVDLLGQANAESLAGHQYSGSGGQLDFVRGAFASRGGKSILVFPSMARGASRIVPLLPTGSMVTTPRNDTHYLATEYGVVDVKGLSSRERAEAIIGLAHPDVRAELRRAAEDLYLL